MEAGAMRTGLHRFQDGAVVFRIDARSIPLAAAAAIALGLSLLAASGALLPGEVHLARALQSTPGGASLDALGDWLALPPVQYGVFVGAMLIAAVRRDMALAAAAVLVLLALGLNPVMKEIVGRARPGVADIRVTEHPGGFGFPSGHTMTATLLYGYVAIVAVRSLPRAVAAGIAGFGAAAIALVGFERVYSGAHWPSDVAGGLTIGLVLLTCGVALARAVAARSHRARVHSS
jgi:membrane-associated phospholipid phosphatase